MWPYRFCAVIWSERCLSKGCSRKTCNHPSTLYANCCFPQASATLNLYVDHSLQTQLVTIACRAQELFQCFICLSFSLHPLPLSPRASCTSLSLVLWHLLPCSAQLALPSPEKEHKEAAATQHVASTSGRSLQQSGFVKSGVWSGTKFSCPFTLTKYQFVQTLQVLTVFHGKRD